MAFYWIYEIKCLPTNQVYIGKSLGVWPFFRWADHFSGLNKGKRPPKFQEVWDAFPDLKYWQFRVLDRVEGRVNSKRREAELILAVPEHQRINSSTTSTLSSERRKMVLEGLESGLMYKEIAKMTGVSMGTISKIKHGRL